MKNFTLVPFDSMPIVNIIYWSSIIPIIFGLFGMYEVYAIWITLFNLSIGFQWCINDYNKT